MTTRSGPAGGLPDPGLDAIMSERRRLIDLAYRLLGSLAEAEDAGQETYARWYPGWRSGAVTSPAAQIRIFCRTGSRAAGARRAGPRASRSRIRALSRLRCS
jgi:Sigma-70 region 2